MHKNTIPALVAAILLLGAMAPLATAVRDPHDQVRDVTGPLTHHDKNVGETAINLMHCSPDPSFPVAPCEPNPGGIASLGGASFPSDAWNSDPDVSRPHAAGRDVRIWVEWRMGMIFGGFSAMVCADVDDNSMCEPGGPDVMVRSFAGTGDGPCEGEDKKDKKDCDDETELEIHACIPRDDWTGIEIRDDGTATTVTDQDWDNFLVFIQSWSDTTLIDNPKNNNGAGLNTGEFKIYIEHGDFLSHPDCVKENETDWDEIPTTADGPN